jgi:hypothetical protein
MSCRTDARFKSRRAGDKFDRTQQCIRFGDATPGNIEGGAMADAGENESRADRHRRGIAAGEKLDRDVTLIVIHRDEGIDVAPPEHEIGAERSFHLEAGAAQACGGRHGDARVVVTEQPALAGMRVDAEQTDFRPSDPR